MDASMASTNTRDLIGTIGNEAQLVIVQAQQPNDKEWSVIYGGGGHGCSRFCPGGASVVEYKCNRSFGRRHRAYPLPENRTREVFPCE